MKSTVLAVAAATTMMIFAQSAYARDQHHRHYHHDGHHHRLVATRGGGRPDAWCGWEMRHLVGADPGPSFNLARNWTRWGRPGAAGIGAVVVWPHHVGKIVGQAHGEWIVESGNDGHALRTRPRSIAGAIGIRWG